MHYKQGRVVTGVELSNLQTFVGTIRTLKNFFDPALPLTITRAPRHVDVMGGIADYSGSLVLQRPIAEATFAALKPADQPLIEIISTRHETRKSPELLI